MDGGQRNLGRTVLLGGAILVAVGLIAAGIYWPGTPTSPETPETGAGETSPTDSARQPEPAPASLQRLAGRGDLAEMQRRIDAGADVDALAGAEDPALEGMSALMVAVRNNSSEATALLLSNGADPNARGEEGRTALAIAAEEGSAEMVEMLLEAGANPAAANDAGRTPLMAAAGGEEPDVVILLLNAGADPSARDASGRSAIDLASARRDGAGRTIAAMLREASGG